MIEYGDLVKVKEGFYKNCKGIVVDYCAQYRIYDVEIAKIVKGFEKREKIIEVYEDNIEKAGE